MEQLSRDKFLTLDEMLALIDRADLITGSFEVDGVYYCYFGKTPEEVATNPYVRTYEKE